MLAFIDNLNAYGDSSLDLNKSLMVMTTSFIRQQIDMGYVTSCIKYINISLTLSNSWFTMIKHEE